MIVVGMTRLSTFSSQCSACCFLEAIFHFLRNVAREKSLLNRYHSIPLLAGQTPPLLAVTPSPKGRVAKRGGGDEERVRRHLKRETRDGKSETRDEKRKK